MGLLRQALKPCYLFWKYPEYRAYLRVQRVCRKASNRSVTVWLNGFVIEGNDGPSLLHQYEEIIRRKSFDFTTSTEQPVIYCCGANIGLEVMHLEQLYPQAKIKAYEPDIELFSVLISNIERNESKAVAVNAAVYTSAGQLQFASDGKLGGKLGEGLASVQTIRLRDELAKETHIDLLIMDIEGCETEVLKDCSDQLSKVGSIFVEWHSDQNKVQSLQEVLQLLQSAGFRYRLNNNLGEAPFLNPVVENGFDAMVEIYATRAPKA